MRKKKFVLIVFALVVLAVMFFPSRENQRITTEVQQPGKLQDI